MDLSNSQSLLYYKHEREREREMVWGRGVDIYTFEALEKKKNQGDFFTFSPNHRQTRQVACRCQNSFRGFPRGAKGVSLTAIDPFHLVKIVCPPRSTSQRLSVPSVPLLNDYLSFPFHSSTIVCLFCSTFNDCLPLLFHASAIVCPFCSTPQRLYVHSVPLLNDCLSIPFHSSAIVFHSIPLKDCLSLLFYPQGLSSATVSLLSDCLSLLFYPQRLSESLF